MKSLCKNAIVIPLLLSSFFVLAQSDSAKVNFVKTQFALINDDLKSYKKVVKEDTAESTEGNEITLYFKGDTIKKISATYYGETGKTLNEFYFFDKKLMFYYFVEYRYNVSINVNNGKVKIASTKEKRYYFNDGKIFMIKLKPRETISPTEFKNLSVETHKEARRLMNLK